MHVYQTRHRVSHVSMNVSNGNHTRHCVNILCWHVTMSPSLCQHYYMSVIIYIIYIYIRIYFWKRCKCICTLAHIYAHASRNGIRLSEHRHANKGGHNSLLSAPAATLHNSACNYFPPRSYRQLVHLKLAPVFNLLCVMYFSAIIAAHLSVPSSPECCTTFLVFV